MKECQSSSQSRWDGKYSVGGEFVVRLPSGFDLVKSG